MVEEYPLTATLSEGSDGSFPYYSWPGCYPLFYLMKDGGHLCPGCANKEIRLIVDATLAGDDPQWELVAIDANWEDPSLHCYHCDKRIESAYAEEEASI